MSKKRRCPGCSMWLDINSEECYCGWESSTNHKMPNHQCNYAIDEYRCPYDASIYRNSKWYCRDHFQNLKDQQRCKQIILEAYKNYEEVMDSRIDWRVKLIPEEYAIRKSMISEMFLRLNIKRKI